MKKFKFVPKKTLYEDDAQQVSQETDNQQNNSEEQSKQTVNGKSLESNEQYMKICEYGTNLEQKYSQDSASQQKLINAAIEAAANKPSNCEYDHVQTNEQVISAKLRLLEIQHNFENARYQNEKKKLQLCQQLAQVANENARKEMLPDKISNLSESELEQHKIYVDQLIFEGMPIENTQQMFSVFEHSTLAYGKDRYGEFAICVDKEDLIMLHEMLVGCGYPYPRVVDTIQPQLYQSGVI